MSEYLYYWKRKLQFIKRHYKQQTTFHYTNRKSSNTLSTSMDVGASGKADIWMACFSGVPTLNFCICHSRHITSAIADVFKPGFMFVIIDVCRGRQGGTSFVGCVFGCLKAVSDTGRNLNFRSSTGAFDLIGREPVAGAFPRCSWVKVVGICDIMASSGHVESIKSLDQRDFKFLNETNPNRMRCKGC